MSLYCAVADLSVVANVLAVQNTNKEDSGEMEGQREHAQVLCSWSDFLKQAGEMAQSLRAPPALSEDPRLKS